MDNYLTLLKNFILRPLKVRYFRNLLNEFLERDVQRATLYRFRQIALPLSIKAIEDYPIQTSGIEYSVPIQEIEQVSEKSRVVKCSIYHAGFNRFNLYVGENAEKPEIIKEAATIEFILGNDIFFSPFLNLSTARKFVHDLSQKTNCNLEEQIERGLKERFPTQEK